MCCRKFGVFKLGSFLLVRFLTQTGPTRANQSCNRYNIYKQQILGIFLVVVQYMNTQLLAFFFSTGNLDLLDCSVTWSLLTRTDADWTCWLTADARVLKHKHKFETDPDSCQWLPYHTQVVHCLQTLHCWLRLIHQTMAEQLHPQQPSHDDTHAQERLPTRFQETAQSEQHWHSDADIEGFICRILKIVNECTSRSNMP